MTALVLITLVAGWGTVIAATLEVRRLRRRVRAMASTLRAARNEIGSARNAIRFWHDLAMAAENPLPPSARIYDVEATEVPPE